MRLEKDSIAGAVCIVGTIYDRYQREKLQVELKRQKRLESVSRLDDWRPSGGGGGGGNNYYYNDNTARRTSQYDSSQQYNDSNSTRATVSNHQQISSSTYTNPYTSANINRSFNESSYITTNNSNNFGPSIRQTDFGHNDVSSSVDPGGYAARDFGPNQLADSHIAYALRDDNQSIPTATGFSSDCVDWVNRILFLFYSQANKYGPIIGENFYRSLNEKLANIVSSSVDYSDWLIEFKSIDMNSSTKPELKNVRTENESDKSVSAVCKIYNQRLVCSLQLQRARSSLVRGIFSHNNPEDLTLNYELTLENLEGKLKSVAMFSDKLIVAQFIEKPDSKILLRQLKNEPPSVRSPMNEDTLVSLILQALTQVVVDLYFGDEPDFPQFVKQHQQSGYRNKLSQLKGSANEIKRQIKHDFLGALNFQTDNKDRKIFVKLLRAKNINYNQNVTCILELDQPKQHAISSIKQGSNPFWDEHFLFIINEKQSSSHSNDKLTLELWDSLDPSRLRVAKQKLQLDSAGRQKSTSSKLSGAQKVVSQFNKDELTASGKFLGLARLSIDELCRNPVQKQTLMLQSRELSEPPPNSMIGGLDLSDSIGGELHLELMFLEHSNSQSIEKSSSANSINSLSGGGGGSGVEQGDVVSVDRRLTSSGYLITTTTIAKPAGSQQHKRASSKDRLSPVGLARNHSPVSSATEQSQLLDLDGLSTTQISDQLSADHTSSQQVEDRASRADSRQSRSRSRSGGFLRAIKRRFSFSRNRRSRSVSESASPSSSPFPVRAESHSGLHQHHRHHQGRAQNNMDAISIDSRSRASSEVSLSGRAKSMPASRDSNEVPTIVINKSRLSDASTVFTFAQPKSQLVIECQEPKMSGIDGGPTSSSSKDKPVLFRHYAIPDDAASERRWRRRGVKLHLFNEHQFVACHLAGSSTCHLCGRVFSRRPGKQGYKCRNCHLLSHKQCHVKVDHICPYATKDGLKLEYIDADPPASLVFEKTHSTTHNNSNKNLTDQLHD